MLHHTVDPAQRAFDIAEHEAEAAYRSLGPERIDYFAVAVAIEQEVRLEMATDLHFRLPYQGFTPRRHPRRGASFFKQFAPETRGEQETMSAFSLPDFS